jgi:hypothetical protein
LTALHHPQAPSSVKPAVAALVDRGRRCVSEALRGIELETPAFALCLFPSDDARGLAPDNIALGLESDRERAQGAESPFAVFDDVWNPTRYSYISLDEFADPVGEPRFDAASTDVLAWLDAERVGDPATWLLEELAAELTRVPPIEPVTDDFACWVFAQGDRLIDSLRWILPAETQAKLEGKGLLVDDPDELEGADAV